jgi:hypothetical protein
MATGRIGSTPVLRVRWSDQPAAGTTVLSGLDDNSVALVYDAGYEAVYRNGALLSRGNDYTATDGTTVTLLSATLAGDIIEIFANDLVPLTDAISKGQYTAKGALLSATAASTPGVLPVGTNGQYLSADSTASTGLAWASVSAGANWSLLNAGGTALTAAQTITVSGISAKDKIMIFVTGASSANSASRIRVRLNTDTASNYYAYGFKMVMESVYASQEVSKGYTLNDDAFVLAQMATNAASQVHGSVEISGANSSGVKIIKMTGGATGGGGNTQENHSAFGYYNSSTVISSISINSESGNFDAGTVFVYTSA